MINTILSALNLDDDEVKIYLLLLETAPITVGNLAKKLQLFEGQDGLKNILKDILLYSNMQTEAFWPQKKMVDILSPDFLRYHNKERIKNNLYIRPIWPQDQMV